MRSCIPWTSVPIDCTAERLLGLFFQSASHDGLLAFDGDPHAGVVATQSLSELSESFRPKIQEWLSHVQKWVAKRPRTRLQQPSEPDPGTCRAALRQREGEAKSQAEAAEGARLEDSLDVWGRMMDVLAPEGITLRSAARADSKWIAMDAMRLQHPVMTAASAP